SLVLVGPALEVGAHGLGVHRGAVVEGDALLELEGPGEAVLALPAGRQLGDGLGAALLDADEVLEDLAGDAEGLAVAGVERVERRRGAGGAEDEGGVAAGGCLALAAA